jgi:hypothetical protein
MHGFGYVGRMIAHPLDILGAKDEMHAEYHGSGILDHVREQLAKKRSIYAVNVLVTGPNFDRFCHISTGETIQHIPQLIQHQGRHVSHATHYPPRHVFLFDGADAFADIFCQIADALELMCNPQYSYELPQINSYWLAPSNSLHGAFLDGPLHDVDRRICGHYLPPAFLVAISQCPDRLDDLSFDEAAHFRDSAVEHL